jgi:hypothetical protein
VENLAFRAQVMCRWWEAQCLASTGSVPTFLVPFVVDDRLFVVRVRASALRLVCREVRTQKRLEAWQALRLRWVWVSTLARRLPGVSFRLKCNRVNNIPSTFLLSARPFRRLAASVRSFSLSFSRSSFWCWLRAAAPRGFCLGADARVLSSSDSSTGEPLGEREPVRWRLISGLVL